MVVKSRHLFVRHYCLLKYFFTFYLGKCKQFFKVLFRPCSVTTKTQVKMPQKSKIELIELIG